MSKFNVLQHKLVPRHILLSPAEKDALLKKYEIDIYQLPKIYARDPCARALRAKPGDVIKIVRESKTAGTSIYYRVVIED